MFSWFCFFIFIYLFIILLFIFVLYLFYQFCLILEKWNPLQEDTNHSGVFLFLVIIFLE